MIVHQSGWTNEYRAKERASPRQSRLGVAGKHIQPFNLRSRQNHLRIPGGDLLILVSRIGETPLDEPAEGSRRLPTEKRLLQIHDLHHIEQIRSLERIALLA